MRHWYLLSVVFAEHMLSNWWRWFSNFLFMSSLLNLALLATLYFSLNCILNSFTCLNLHLNVADLSLKCFRPVSVPLIKTDSRPNHIWATIRDLFIANVIFVYFNSLMPFPKEPHSTLHGRPSFIWSGDGYKYYYTTRQSTIFDCVHHLFIVRHKVQKSLAQWTHSNL